METEVKKLSIDIKEEQKKAEESIKNQGLRVWCATEPDVSQTVQMK